MNTGVGRGCTAGARFVQPVFGDDGPYMEKTVRRVVAAAISGSAGLCCAPAKKAIVPKGDRFPTKDWPLG
jgi:hypothetical protein